MRLAASFVLVGLCALAWSGCCCPAGPFVPPTPPVPTPPTPTPPSTPQPVSGVPSGPPGGGQVQVDGRNVWPPVGPGCDRYVACCDAARSVNGAIGLACQLSVSTPPVDCERSRGEIRQMITEMGLTPPPTCAP